MPLSKNTKYRVVTTKTGKKVRLAWEGGEVVEAKNIETGDTHTPEEFKEDKKKKEEKKKHDKKSKKH